MNIEIVLNSFLLLFNFIKCFDESLVFIKLIKNTRCLNITSIFIASVMTNCIYIITGKQYIIDPRSFLFVIRSSYSLFISFSITFRFKRLYTLEFEKLFFCFLREVYEFIDLYRLVSYLLHLFYWTSW